MGNNPVKSTVQKFDLPRIIVVSSFIFLVIAASGFQMSLAQFLSDCVCRWGMFGILTLAMVPAVQCGIGPNSGISMDIVSGLLDSLIVIELGVARIPVLVTVSPMFEMWVSMPVAIVIGVILAAGIGYLYDPLLNRVRDSGMTVTTYVGFSIIAFTNMPWMLLPFQNGELKQPNAGKGLRNIISLSTSFNGVMNDTLFFEIDKFTMLTDLLLFMFFICLLAWLFMKSKTDMATPAVGSNPIFAKAVGINVSQVRLMGTTLSIVLVTVGIIVYAQGFGSIQLYNGSMMMGFNSVTAALIGGVSPKRAGISNVLIGVFLFQGILALGLPVASQFIPKGNLLEAMRLIISNSIIIYALTQAKEGDGRKQKENAGRVI